MTVTYKKSGVNIDAGNELVKRIKKRLPKIGGFGGLFPIDGTKYNLVSSTDGVGTKLKIAFLVNKHDTVGQDLVAMNVNDIINKHFSRVFRGYDIQEVDAFLDEIIEDYEAFEKNNELMIMRINALLDEIERLENLLEKQNLQNKQQ